MNTKRYLVFAATLLFAGNIIHAADAPEAQPDPAAEAKKKPAGPKPLPPLVQPRQRDGSGTVVISGELKQWHKVTLTLDGLFGMSRIMNRIPSPIAR